jgi:ADP-ribosylglycohydrolase/protein-tyrosine phosphatase
MTLKTSVTHPLRIDAIETPAGGLLGLTFCPGKKDRHSAWDRDLAADVQAIADWGAGVLVTLIEQHEFGILGVERLEERVRAAGLAWLHLPIRDVDVPDQRFEKGWRDASVHVHAILQARGRVIVHCRGGLGRAGTVAARVLVEQGVDPREAVQRVRRARPGAIETSAQERYVLGLKPRDAAVAVGATARVPGATEVPHCLARIRGCVLGGAVGDAFGYCVEFDRWPDIARRYGKQGILEPELQAGQLVVSDDTQMTLFTLEGLLRAMQSSPSPSHDRIVESIREAYLDWHRTQERAVDGAAMTGALGRHLSLHHRRAPGRTCLDAVGAGARGTLHQPVNDSKGCGGVMRVAPLAFFPERIALEAAFELGARAAALTHGHPSGYLSAGALAGILHGLMRHPSAPGTRAGEGAVLNAVNATLPLLHASAQSAETLAALEHALAAASAGKPTRQAVASLGEGWVGEEALSIGLYACLVASDFKDAVRIASNHDGDSDSTASIAGQLYGAWQGEQALPGEWVARLDVLAPLEELLRQASAVSRG